MGWVPGGFCSAVGRERAGKPTGRAGPQGAGRPWDHGQAGGVRPQLLGGK